MSLILSFFSIQNLTHKTNPKIQISKKIKNKKIVKRQVVC